MPDTVDVLCLDGNPVPIVADSLPPIDMLSRHGIVSQIMALIDSISSTHGSCTFALNGSWGSGKTFVLDMLERQLCDYQAGEKYIVFHYNCWKYDYYEEPLVAIVSAMFDGLDEQAHLIPQGVKDKLVAVLTTIAKALAQLALPIVKSKLGLDALDLANLPDILLSDGESQYDPNYSFNKAINKIKEELKKFSKDKTIIVVVDELDRCLPDYAIKVLERLHHLFDKLPNTVVALAIDKGQLENTVKRIFGEQTDTARYLKKFINLEFQLDNGEITGCFSEKYSSYVSLFDNTFIEQGFSIDEYFSALFDGIDIRTQEQMLSRIETVHRILFPVEKKDTTFLCFELFWIAQSIRPLATNQHPIRWTSDHFILTNNSPQKFVVYMQRYWNFSPIQRTNSSSPGPTRYTLPQPISTPKLLLWYYSQLYTHASPHYVLANIDNQLHKYEQNVQELRKVIDLLKIIK